MERKVSPSLSSDDARREVGLVSRPEKKGERKEEGGAEKE